MKFLRNLLAAILGVFIALGIIFFFFILIGSLLGNEDKVIVKSNSVLELRLEDPIKDYAPKDDNPFAEILGVYEPKLGLNTILNAIENAKTDANIKGISINTTGINAGISQTQAIRKKLDEFKESGKFINAYADYYNQKNYYLSSVADSIFLNPVGSVDFKGLQSEVLFYKDFEDKTGLKFEVIRHGKYKGAVEPFIASEMSAENREQITSFLTSIWTEMIQEIGVSRNKTLEELNLYADNLAGRNAEKALEAGLIDKAIYIDEYEDRLKEKTSQDKVNTITIADYIKSGKGKVLQTAKDKIAVIYAQGEIMYGKGNEDIIGQDLIINALRKARKNSAVKAIVLRVNSPGGSALASELIWRELELTKAELPLVVSMGNLAASGGYYIACNADKIIAEPTTITGSIGVFGAIPNASKLADKIGINAEQVSTNKSPSYSVFEPITKGFYDVTKESIEQIYTTFVNRVAAGRNMNFDEVDKIAQGRVWSGKEALEIGLVDQLGGLDEAIAEAAKLADISDYKISNYPRYKKDFEEMLDFGFRFSTSKNQLIKEEIGEENYEIYQNIKQLSKLKGAQARMPYLIEIR